VESGWLLVGKVRECDVESQHLQDCCPRLCRFRIDGLAPASKYWMYWSHASFAPTTSMTMLGEKLGMDLWIGQSLCCGLGWEPFFSWAVVLLNSVNDYTKGYYVQTAWDMYGREPYKDRAWDACGVLVRFPLQGIHRCELSPFSYMSNCMFMSVRT
jgi:hypothetical protein